ncbi:MAG TPA: hypothetical protein PLJ27_23550 [Polyangiaceae bacterium]|nr:MAG: hypothetical protein BWY17_01210 [Deltaproteobacteria bacterium ADurb.Bin207]HNS96931.1 hypothetical protein [Polyangiaceae bacterium]HNZ21282.1 hypothetical protein [Polyangiaceae bacterium]HOD21032.1 hypothetical protein [Polyangiaceae bacterium]HOE48670.1 hypothetical protein [Polyangiaceae bacterium]
MTTPLAPGPRRFRWAPLPTISLLVGSVLCAFALTCSVFPKLVADLAHDPLFVRALGVTVGMAGFMLGRVSWQAAAGPRRMTGLLIAIPLLVLALFLVVNPTYAVGWHTTGRTVFIPWIFGVPGVSALLLSRWRVS